MPKLPAVEVNPPDTIPSGDEYYIARAMVHEGSIIALYGTNDKMIGWIDSHAWTKDHVYRDRFINKGV